MTKRPHIIIFNPDQMQGACLAHLGENPAAQTPFLDSLAQEEAVSYRFAYCQNPVCVPSRCSFLTGLYPHVHGHRTMRYMLHAEESSIFSELKKAGYHVWMNSRNDFLPGQDSAAFERQASEIFYGGDCSAAPGAERANPRGKPGEKDYFSHYKGRLGLDTNGRNYSRDDEAVDAAISRAKTPTEDGRPLCLFLGLMYPHPPYAVEEPYFSAIDPMKLPPRVRERAAGSFEPRIERLIRSNQGMQAYEEKDWDALRAVYLGMCRKIDNQFQRLCEGLKEAGIYDDCAIFFFSDHGDYQGQFGLSEKNQNTFEESLVRVPFLIKPPKGTPVDPGICNGLVELVDFYATAMDFAQVVPDHTNFGHSLRKSLADRSTPLREYVCCEGGRLAGEIHCDESHATGPKGAQPDNEYWPRMKAQEDDTAHTKATMIRTMRYKYVRRLYEQDQLFDLQNDPGETRDLSADLSMRDTICDLQMKMLDWYQATCDIVPYEYDSRLNSEMIWAMLKHVCPPEKKVEIKRLADQNIPMYKIIQWATGNCSTEDQAPSSKESGKGV